MILLSSSSLAQDSCMVRPSCTDMGYTKSATDCVGKKAISCPFDTTAYYCPEVGESCDFSEYPLTECPTGGNCTEFECGDIAQFKLNSCQNNYEISTDGMTCNACDFSGYTLSSCPDNGNCTSKTCGGTKKYKLNYCDSDYYQSGNECFDCGCVYGCEYAGSYDDECGCYTHCCSTLYSNCTDLCSGEGYYVYECLTDDATTNDCHSIWCM